MNADWRLLAVISQIASSAQQKLTRPLCVVFATTARKHRRTVRIIDISIVPLTFSDVRGLNSDCWSGFCRMSPGARGRAASCHMMLSCFRYVVLLATIRRSWTEINWKPARITVRLQASRFANPAAAWCARGCDAVTSRLAATGGDVIAARLTVAWHRPSTRCPFSRQREPVLKPNQLTDGRTDARTEARMDQIVHTPINVLRYSSRQHATQRSQAGWIECALAWLRLRVCSYIWRNNERLTGRYRP